MDGALVGLVLTAAVRPADAACSAPPSALTEIVVQSCRVLNAEEAWPLDVKVVNEKGIATHYGAALVTDASGTTYTYPSALTDPCREFPVEHVVTKIVESICCDTGFVAQCQYGGRWLRDLDGRPNGQPDVIQADISRRLSRGQDDASK